MLVFGLKYLVQFGSFAVLVPHLPFFLTEKSFSITQVGMLLSAFGLALGFVTLLGVTFRTIFPMTDTLALHNLRDPTHQYGRVRTLGSLGFIVGSLAVQFGGFVRPGAARSLPLVFAVVMALTSIVGPFAGGFLIQAWGHQALFLIYTLPTAVALVMAVAWQGAFRQVASRPQELRP
jgi:hypothetical protein